MKRSDLGLVVAGVLLLAAASRRKAVERGRPETSPVPPATPSPVPGAPTPAPDAPPRPKAVGTPTHFETGASYRAIVQLSFAQGLFANGAEVAHQVHEATGMPVKVTTIGKNRYQVDGWWHGPRTPVPPLPPEVVSLREV